MRDTAGGSTGSFWTPARRAEAALVLVTLAWGLTFPMIKGALAEVPPFTFLALRFPVALVILWPLLRGRIPARTSLPAGLVLGGLLAVSLYAQTQGLVYTTSTRSAFITGLSVILVPILYPVMTRRFPARWVVAGAAIALAGLYLLTNPDAGGLNRGDAITLLCALGFAIYIIFLEIASRKHPYEDLLVCQFVVLSVVFAPLAIGNGGAAGWGRGLVLGIAVTGPIFALTVYLQNRFQKNTTAPRAAVIFAGEPVFAAIFSYLLLAETLSPVQWGGGALILLGILAAEKR